MIFENLPEARQTASVQQMGSVILLRSLQTMAARVNDLHTYAADVIHPMFNDNRAANLVYQCHSAAENLEKVVGLMDQVNAQMELIVTVLNEYSPEST